MLTAKKTFYWLTVTTAGYLLSASAVFADQAGNAQFVSGTVQITDSSGRVRGLQKGGVINEGDTLTSSKFSVAQIRMVDGGFIAVRPETELKFDQFKFGGKNGAEEKSFFGLIKGGFRAVTGLIGRVNKQNYRITTPAATIGIRGTDHETVVVLPNTLGLPPGTYNMVNTGETAMTTDAGAVYIRPGEGMAFSPGMTQSPIVMPVNAQLFNAAPESAPAPAAAQDNQGEQNGGQQQAANETGGESSAVAENGDAGSAGNGAQNPEPSVAAGGESVRESAVVDNMASTVPTAVSAGTGAGGGAAPASAPAVVVPPTSVPVTLTNTATGTTLNTTTQTQTQGGVTTTLLSTVVTQPAVTTAIPVDNRIAWEIAALYWGQALSAPADVLPQGNPPSFTERFGLAGNTYQMTITMTGATGPTQATAPGGIQYGSWTNVSTPTWSDSYPFGPGNGMSGSTWIYGPTAFWSATPMAGVVNYALDGRTTPTDYWNGGTGVLNSAALSADFTNMTVSLALNLTFGANTYGSDTAGMIMSAASSSGSFWGSSIVTQNGVACTSCSGSVQGAFSAQDFAGAMAQYIIWDGLGSQIEGVAAFTRNAVMTPVTPVAGYNVYARNGWWGNVTAVTNTGGVLTGYATGQTSQSVSCVAGGCTGAAATDVSNTGIRFGSWDQGTMYWSGSGTAGPQHWITGPVAGPVYLPEVLLGTATYAMTGASPVTDMTAVNGPVNGTLNSAALTVNFTQQTVAVSMAGAVGGNSFLVTTPAGGEATLSGNGNGSGMSTNSAFWFNVNCSGCINYGSSGNVSVAVNGTATTVRGGYVSGQLTGQGLTGAILSYQLMTSSPIVSTLQGVAALGLSANTPINMATPYRMAVATMPSYTYQGTGAGVIGGFNNSTRIALDGVGNLNKFDASNNGLAQTYSIAGATAVERGMDPVSGISWGRWSGGTMSVLNRATVGVAPATQATPASGMHWLLGPSMTAAVDLPVSGTFNYVLAGGTTPTDQTGVTGVVQAATLSANFTAMTANVGLTVAMPTATITANATGMPISTSGFFNADSRYTVQQGVAGTVNCTGAGCGVVSYAKVDGVLTGAGAIGAGVIYGLQTGTMTVGGVAAFHR